MKVFIAEDELPALERLVETLGRAAPQARVVGHAASVSDTRRWLAAHPAPDLLLMDIQLADGLSLELFEGSALAVPTIFTTAYDEFALAAFRALALDYLLKPVSDDALAHALQRLALWRECLGAPLAQAWQQLLTQPGPPRWRQRWLARQGAAFVAVASEQVAWFVSLDKLSFAVTHDGARHLLSETLAQVEAEADPARFFRVNRQVIVSASAIARIVPEGKGRLSLQLMPTSGGAVTVPQERAAAFRQWLVR